MCSPIYLMMLPVCEKLALLTGYTAWARGPSNSIATYLRCSVLRSVLSDNALADGAEGLHFSAIYSYNVLARVEEGEGLVWRLYSHICVVPLLFLEPPEVDVCNATTDRSGKYFYMQWTLYQPDMVV